MTFAKLSQCHRTTGATGAASTANAMDIVFGLHRQTVIDHVRDAGYVKAARRNVGRHKNLDTTVTKILQTAVTHLLRHTAMQGFSAKAFGDQVISQGFGIDLRAGKDQCLLDRRVAQPVTEQAALVLQTIGPMQGLRDVGVTILRGRQFQPTGIFHQVRRQLHDARRKGCRVHQGLFAGCAGGGDTLQIFGKA